MGLQQLTRWQMQGCTSSTMATRSCLRLEELEPMFQRRVRLRAHRCSATRAMCKTSWETFSLWALGHSGGSAPLVALRTSPPQIKDNIKWISEAGKHEMVVGSQARILYSDQRGRTALALRFNAAIAAGAIEGTIVISRDHHDVSGTDSPFRETSNIYDGSAFTADMAVQNCIGDASRGATWVSLHNGGGVGWGEVMNGGFGMVLDGSAEAHIKAESMLNWDVSNGVARRAWSGNNNAQATIKRAMDDQPLLRVTNAHTVEDDQLLEKLFI